MSHPAPRARKAPMDDTWKGCRTGGHAGGGVSTAHRIRAPGRSALRVLAHRVVRFAHHVGGVLRLADVLVGEAVRVATGWHLEPPALQALHAVRDPDHQSRLSGSMMASIVGHGHGGAPSS